MVIKTATFLLVHIISSHLEPNETTQDCVPYVSGNGSVPACTDSSQQCTSVGEQFKYYQAMNYSQVGDLIDPSHHIEAIMEALMDGPVDATFNVYADFDAYQSGVYQHKYGAYEGLHSVKVIGYGVENGTDYWFDFLLPNKSSPLFLISHHIRLVQNSWGPSWGSLGGFFKIIRGSFREQLLLLLFESFFCSNGIYYFEGIDDCGFEALMYTGFPLL